MNINSRTVIKMDLRKLPFSIDCMMCRLGQNDKVFRVFLECNAVNAYETEVVYSYISPGGNRWKITITIWMFNITMTHWNRFNIPTYEALHVIDGCIKLPNKYKFCVSKSVSIIVQRASENWHHIKIQWNN